MTGFVVYMLRCDNDSLYTGYTTDLEKRYQAHLAGKCKYTRSFKPTSVVCSWIIESKLEALRLERWIKKLSRREKEVLVLSPEKLFSQIHKN